MSAADAALQEPQQDIQEAVTSSAAVAALETLCQAAKTQGVLRRASKQAGHALRRLPVAVAAQHHLIALCGRGPAGRL